MDFLTLLGLVAGTLTTIAFLPQVLKIWQSKSAKDFSFGMLITFNLGLFLWLVYGLYKNELPIILANLITFTLNSLIIVLKVKYQSIRGNSL
jgi:MtN3 and saliva related transmembrane protein